MKRLSVVRKSWFCACLLLGMVFMTQPASGQGTCRVVGYKLAGQCCSGVICYDANGNVVSSDVTCGDCLIAVLKKNRVGSERCALRSAGSFSSRRPTHEIPDTRLFRQIDSQIRSSVQERRELGVLNTPTVLDNIESIKRVSLVDWLVRAIDRTLKAKGFTPTALVGFSEVPFRTNNWL